LLIDSSHKRWFLVTLVLALAALAVYAVFWWNSPGGLTGGSILGVWYGLLGSALMVYAGLLSALRKVPSWWWIGSRKVWLRGHIWLGLLSGVFILCHSGCRWGGPLEVILWVVLIATLATGVG
jgi:drug/metabolite transporter (DMT)-like permease